MTKFDNKFLEAIRLPKILNNPYITKTMPCNLEKKDSIPTVTYKLGNTVINKILNYKDAINSIYVNERVSFNLNTDLCDCEKSKFSDPHPKHIITGDLTTIENKKLRKI